MSDESSGSRPVRITLKFALNIALVWFMAEYMSDYFQLFGGVFAYVAVGALVTLMNMFVRPILMIVTLPLKLFATILAVIIVNGVFIQLTVSIINSMDQQQVRLEIFGGLLGWTIVAVSFGVANWLMKASIK